jgi:hypothetical protein
MFRVFGVFRGQVFVDFTTERALGTELVSEKLKAENEKLKTENKSHFQFSLFSFQFVGKLF